MSMENLVICIENGGNVAEATALSERIGAPLSAERGAELTLLFGADGVSLCGYGMTFRGDFAQMLRRLCGGHLQHEMLAHVAKTKEEHPTAIDATAGMGEDSILLAASGYDVTLFEQNPVVAALLRDALRRGAECAELAEIVGRMQLIEGDSIEYMRSLATPPSLIYLDPMFPERQKSGLINKKLQLIQKLEQPCSLEAEMLEAAIAAKPKKIIVKRPLKGDFLAEKKPHYSIKGKAIRYDCFAFPNN